jgi:hypothetical protein
MTSTSPEPVYTNGRLVVDEDMAFDIIEMIENRRVLTLIIRADLRASGFEDAAQHLTERLSRLRHLSKRVNALILEKNWGDLRPEEDGTALLNTWGGVPTPR